MKKPDGITLPDLDGQFVFLLGHNEIQVYITQTNKENVDLLLILGHQCQIQKCKPYQIFKHYICNMFINKLNSSLMRITWDYC